MRATLSCLLLCLAATTVASAQSAKDAENDLKARMQHKQLYLRGNGSDAVMTWTWDGTKIVAKPPTVHQLAPFTARSVKWKRDQLEITGFLNPLFLDKKGNLTTLTDKDATRIVVELAGAPQPQAADVFAALFYPTLEAAEAELPVNLRVYLPPHMNDARPFKPTPVQQDTACDCGHPEAKTCQVKPSGQNIATVTPPRLIHAVEPEFSESSRQQQFSGNVQVYLKVDSEGEPANIWIVHALGMGLDQKAGEAVSQYRFAPATCNGQPVAVDLYIEVNFTTF